MSPYFLSLCAAILLLLSSCSHDKPAESPFISGACSDLEISSVSYTVFPQTLELWFRSFRSLYDAHDPGYPALCIPGELLNTYRTGGGICGGEPCYDGFKAYLGLDTIISNIGQLEEHLQLIITPYVGNNDITFPPEIGPFLLINRNGSQPVQYEEAQQSINNWWYHYDSIITVPNIREMDSIMVHIYSFVIPDSTLHKTIINAGSIPNDTVFMLFGAHSVSPMDTSYCVENSPAYNTCPDCYGYFALALILSTNLDGHFERSSDFLRPCPRYCGKSMFTLGEAIEEL